MHSRSGAMSAEHADSALSRISYFRDIPADILGPVAQGVRQVRAARSQIIVHRGEPCCGLHIVVRGKIKLCYEAASGLERIMRIVNPNDSFGEALMFLGRDYITTAEALCDSELLFVRRDAILAQVDRCPQLAQQLVASLSQHLYMMMGDMGAYTVRTSHQRLIGYLLRESGGSQGVPVRFPVAKGVLASRLNLTPQHFSRLLHRLVREGLLLIQGREFTILDVQGLRACYEQQTL